MKKIKTFLKGLAHGLTYTGHIITNIVNTLLLLIIYFVGVGTAAIITKLTKQELMMLEKKNTTTYYSAYCIKKSTPAPFTTTRANC